MEVKGLVSRFTTHTIVPLTPNFLSWFEIFLETENFPMPSNPKCCHLAYPVVHVAARWMDTRFSTHKGFLIQRLYLQKASGQGVRTHTPMVLLAMVREEDIWGSWPFTRYQEVTQRDRQRERLLLRVETYIYTALRVLFLSLMVRRYFML